MVHLCWPRVPGLRGWGGQNENVIDQGGGTQGMGGPPPEQLVLYQPAQICTSYFSETDLDSPIAVARACSLSPSCASALPPTIPWIHCRPTGLHVPAQYRIGL